MSDPMPYERELGIHDPFVIPDELELEHELKRPKWWYAQQLRLEYTADDSDLLVDDDADGELTKEVLDVFDDWDRRDAIQRDMDEDPEEAPICACCGTKIGDMWMVTQPKVFVICGEGACERWAWAQGLTIYTTATAWNAGATSPARPPSPSIRRRPDRRTCAHCHGPLPRLRKDRFRDSGREFCTLTCMQSMV